MRAVWKLIQDNTAPNGHSRSIPGTHPDREAAMAAAVERAREIVGPPRESYRTPVISIIDRAPYGACVHIEGGYLIAPILTYISA